MAEALWTAEQLAEYLQLSVETVWRYTREGKLPAIKLGNHYRYPVEEAMEALRKASGGGPGTGDLAKFRMDTGDAQKGAGATEMQADERMTYEEFRKLPEQPGLQLIDGFVVKEPSPRYGHQAIIGELYVRLVTHVRRHRLGEVILAPFDVVLANDQVLQPDIVFVSAKRRSIIKDRGLFGAPDLAVEVLSPSTRRYDEGRKREIYFEHGCLEMWIVDPDAMTLVHAVRGERGWEDTLLKPGDVLVSPTLKGLRINIDDVARDLDLP